MEDILYKSEVYEIVGLCMEVHNYLGNGFLEVVYKDAIEQELREEGINFEREKEFQISYKGRSLKHKFFADFIISDKIILEAKSNREGIVKEHIAQTINYLKVSNCELGLIVNFGKTSLE